MNSGQSEATEALRIEKSQAVEWGLEESKGNVVV